jgi:hypothetical protein
MDFAAARFEASNIVFQAEAPLRSMPYNLLGRYALILTSVVLT